MTANLISIAAFVVVAIASYGFGALSSRVLGLTFADRCSSALWRTSLGLTLAGTFLAWLGVGSLLYRGAIWAMTLIGLTTAILVHRGALTALARNFPSAAANDDAEETHVARSSPNDAPVLLTAAILFLAGAALAATALVALAPPTAGDALCYHLELPKTFLREHQLAYSPDVNEATFPLLTEIWFLWAMAIDGPVAAQLVHFGLGVLLLLAVREAAAPLGARWAWLAAGVATLTPIVTNQMTAPLNDVALATFCALAWAAGERADRERSSRSAWCVAAGLMLGAACAIKFTGLVFAAAWLVARGVKLLTSPNTGSAESDETANASVRESFAARDVRPERRLSTKRSWFIRERATLLLLIVGVAAATAGAWYARAAWYTGNPVHPYFSTAFGHPAETSMRESKRPLGRNPLSWLAAPFDATFVPEKFGGRAHQFGPLFLALWPALLWLGRDRRAWPALALAATYALCWLLLRQNLRFALPMLPFMAIGVVAAWRALPRDGRARMVVLGVSLLMLTFTTAIAVRRARFAWPVAIGVESREEYLFRHEPTAAAAEAVGLLTNADARLLSQETRAFYFDRVVVRESLFRQRTHAYDATTSPESLAAMLRREGFTHLVLAERTTTTSAPYDDVLSSVVAPALANQASAFRLLSETTGRDLDGAEYRYRLVSIETPLPTTR